LSKFAPGSVVKIVMSIAALEEGVATPSRGDHCTGSWRFGDKVYQCWAIRKGGHGYLTMREAIIQSCNIYFYHLGNEMGIERISKWAHLLGFGQLTGIDLPHEEAGTVPDPVWKNRVFVRDPIWHPGETISVSIGQERSRSHRSRWRPSRRPSGTAARCTVRTCSCRARCARGSS